MVVVDASDWLFEPSFSERSFFLRLSFLFPCEYFRFSMLRSLDSLVELSLSVLLFFLCLCFLFLRLFLLLSIFCSLDWLEILTDCCLFACFCLIVFLLTSYCRTSSLVSLPVSESRLFSWWVNTDWSPSLLWISVIFCSFGEAANFSVLRVPQKGKIWAAMIIIMGAGAGSGSREREQGAGTRLSIMVVLFTQQGAGNRLFIIHPAGTGYPAIYNSPSRERVPGYL